jgi:hypothetical protein
MIVPGIIVLQMAPRGSEVGRRVHPAGQAGLAIPSLDCPHSGAYGLFGMQLAREKLRIPANADSDSDRMRTAIPIDRGQRSGDRGQRLPSTASRAHSAVSVSSFPHLPDFSGGLRRVSPSRARRCAVCTRRSRTASAIVGSTIISCQ